LLQVPILDLSQPESVTVIAQRSYRRFRSTETLIRWRRIVSKRGFAQMDPEKQKQIASMGGKAAHQRGTAHQFNSDEAREAGRKGGAMLSRDRQHMAEIGRLGGLAKGRRKQSQENWW
jgi:uncharacterized protein